MQHHTADKLQRLGQIPVLKHENDSQLVILFVYLCFLSSWHVFLSHFVNSMENMKKKIMFHDYLFQVSSMHILQIPP